MPQPGTKKIILAGRECYMPADDVDAAELIARGLAASEDVESAKRALERVKGEFIELVEKRRAGRSSVAIDGLLGGRGKVAWATEKKLDQDAVVRLREKMPLTLATLLFDEQKVYRLAKATKGLMKAPHAADFAPYVAELAACIEVKPKAPAVKFTSDEDSAVDGEGDDE